MKLPDANQVRDARQSPSMEPVDQALGLEEHCFTGDLSTTSGLAADPGWVDLAISRRDFHNHSENLTAQRLAHAAAAEFSPVTLRLLQGVNHLTTTTLFALAAAGATISVGGAFRGEEITTYAGLGFAAITVTLAIASIRNGADLARRRHSAAQQINARGGFHIPNNNFKTRDSSREELALAE